VKINEVELDYIFLLYLINHVTFLLGPNIFLSTLFSNTLSLPSALSVRDQVLHPYKSTCKIIILWNVVLIRLDMKI